MSELHHQLDQLARRVNASNHELGEVRRRSHRHRRNRRIVSAFVSLALAATSIGLAYAAFRPGSETRPAKPGPTEQLLPIWPSGSAEDIDRIQEQVDQGHQPWYVSPQIVAEVFAMEVMGWDRKDVVADVPEAEDGDIEESAIAFIRNPTLAQQAGEGNPGTVLVLQRWRDRADGIFVVHEAFTDGLTPEHPVPGENFGRSIVWDGSLSSVPAEGVLQFSVSQEVGGVDTTRDATKTYHVEYPNNWVHSSYPVATLRLLYEPGLQDAPRGLGYTDRVVSAPALGISAFRLGKYRLEPDSLSSPTPSSSPPPPLPPHSRSNPIVINVINATGVQGPAAVFASSEMSAIGMTGHKGYETRSMGDINSTRDARQRTLIYFDPRYEADALRLKELVFPGAELRTITPGEIAIRVVLGSDFARSNPSLQTHAVLDNFMTARFAGSGAEAFASEEALSYYELGKRGLSLYGYTAGEPAKYGTPRVKGDGTSATFVVTITTKGERIIKEVIQVKMGNPAGQEESSAKRPVVTFARRKG